MIPMNAPIPEVVKPQENPDINTVKTLKDLYQSAALARSTYDKDWKTNMDFYKGKQWNGTACKPVMNIIRSTIQTTIPLLTDGKPGINITPAEPGDFEFSRMLQQLVENWWDKPEVSMSHTLLEPLTDMCIYDAGILKLYWDITAEDGKGDVRVKSVDPNNIYINKEAKDFDKDCYYVIEKMYPTVAWLKRQFPEKASLIKSDMQFKLESERQGIKTVKVQADPDTKQPLELVKDSIFINDSDCRETAECWEIWIDSEEMISYQEEDESGYKKKYPNGKLFTFLPNQNLILQETENPYKHGKKPYVRFIDTLMPHQFWGESTTTSLMAAQRNINLVLSNLISYLKLMANPIWKITSDCGIQKRDITNDIALVLELEPGKLNDVIRDIPPSIQPGVLNLFDTVMRNATVESGINDFSQGRIPVGGMSGDAMETLQESNMTRIRLKERNMQTSLSKMGSMLISLFLQYYNTPRMARIVGNEQMPKYVEFYIEQNKDGSYTYNRKELTYNPNTNSYDPGSYEKFPISSQAFDIKIVAGTSQPIQKAIRANTAFKLKQMGVISNKILLKAIDFPYAQEAQLEEEAAKSANTTGNNQ